VTKRLKIFVVSDIHYASAAERARTDFEVVGIPNPHWRRVARVYRHFIWLRDPFAHYQRLDQLLTLAGGADFGVAVGDYSCDTACIGVGDDAAGQSAHECLAKLRGHFGGHFAGTMGDHELGKFSLFGEVGGLRLASWRRATGELGIKPFWKAELGNYVLCGVVSSLLALPLFEVETLPEERPEWRRLRETHLAEIRAAFAALRPGQRVIVFCHDPSALPFLWREDSVRAKLAHIELTIIGHLHTNLVFWKSRLLAGMPIIRFMGNTPRRLSSALNEARYWRPFNVRLCPSVTGIQLLKDGGYCTIEIDPEAKLPARFEFHRVKW
jgi:hypothetical protein